MTQLLPKSLLALGLTLGLGATTVAAQPAGPRARRSADAPAQNGQRLERRLTVLTERLSLTPAQQAQARTILESSRGQMRGLRQGGQHANRRANRRARRQIQFTTEDQLHAMLSCEQRDAYRLMRRERMTRRMDQRARQHRGNRHGNRGRGNRGQHNRGQRNRGQGSGRGPQGGQGG